MALGRGRATEARVLTQAEMAGTRGGDGRGVNLPTAPDRSNDAVRGVEANTGKITEAGNSEPLPPQRGTAMGEAPTEVS